MYRMIAVVACGLAMLMIGSASSLAATPATPFDTLRMEAPDPQLGGSFGQRMKAAGDLDGDRVGDVWISAYSLDVGGMNDVGRVYAVSGKTRSVLYVIDSPEPQSSRTFFAGFGWSLSTLGDVDGDGVEDLVVGSTRHSTTTAGVTCVPPAAGCNAEQGKAWVFSGALGRPKAPLFELNNPQPQAFGGFASASSNAGDVVKADGTPGKDGIAEILVGAFNNDVPANCGNLSPVPAGCRKDQGQTFLFNGAPTLPSGTQRLVRTLNVPPEDRYVDPATNTCVSPPPNPMRPEPIQQQCGAFGIVAESTGDVDADGFEDHTVSAWTMGISDPGGQPCRGGTPEPNGCNERQGRIYVFSGRDGALIRKFDDPVPQTGALFGLQKTDEGSPGDIDGDGFADVYANGFMQNGPSRGGGAPLQQEGRAWVFSGKAATTGGGPAAPPLTTPLLTLLDPTPEAFASFGYSLARTDYDLDGRPDLYVGSFAGSYVFRGKDGALQKSFDLPPEDQATQPPGNTSLGASLAAPGDLNGDCEPDYVSTSLNYDLTFVNQGRTYFYLSKGSCPAPSPPSPTPSPTPTPPATPPVRPPGPAQGDTVRPIVSGLRASPARFRLGSFLPRLAPRARTGTAVRFSLSESATVRLTFARQLTGRRVGKACRKATRALRKRPPCARFATVSPSVRIRNAKRGANSVRFAGRLTRERALRPGRYRVTVVATDAAGNRSLPRTAQMTVNRSAR